MKILGIILFSSCLFASESMNLAFTVPKSAEVKDYLATRYISAAIDSKMAEYDNIRAIASLAYLKEEINKLTGFNPTQYDINLTSIEPLAKAAVGICLGYGFDKGVDPTIALSPELQKKYQDIVAEIGDCISSSSDHLNENLVAPNTFSGTVRDEHVAKANQLLFKRNDHGSLRFLRKENFTPALRLDAAKNLIEGNLKHKILVLGAHPSQRDHFKFDGYPDSEIFYVDRMLSLFGKTDNTDPHFIRFDLTDLDFLREMANLFAGKFDLITVDWAVTTHFYWTADHIKCFARLLKSGGKFIFDYHPSMVQKFNNAGECLDSITALIATVATDFTRLPFYLLENPAGKFSDPLKLEPAPQNQIYENYTTYLTLWAANNHLNDITIDLKRDDLPPTWNMPTDWRTRKLQYDTDGVAYI